MAERDEGYMQQHLCACTVDLAGEKLTTIHFEKDNLPVPWPEIAILQELHGEQSVYDIKPVALVPRETPLREKERMVIKYGREVVETVYAGKRFNMEFFVPGWPIDPAKAKPKKADRPAPVKIHKPPTEADADAASANVNI